MVDLTVGIPRNGGGRIRCMVRMREKGVRNGCDVGPDPDACREGLRRLDGEDRCISSDPYPSSDARSDCAGIGSILVGGKDPIASPPFKSPLHTTVAATTPLTAFLPLPLHPVVAAVVGIMASEGPPPVRVIPDFPKPGDSRILETLAA
ncbi:hypothetical protein B296_00038920 [Ensete ventricosum]|uniref:Uncharacterized protein n=1 Tax=Ensete ventricosum TaxID=4639 RepID=A0A426ZUY8_ENSVE|nr:hypothetical protein B296_00038920 [Ensete ventricosum]